MGKITILPNTPQNPITLIGERAGICWGADIADQKKNFNRGLDCIESGHGRTLEFATVELKLEGYSARVIREWYTHIAGGPTRLQASTRYIDYNDFDYIIPPSVEKNEKAKHTYNAAMRDLSVAMKQLETCGVPREDVAYLLPFGMESTVVDKRNLRNLIDMSHNRMCKRALWEYRELFGDLCKALTDYSNEWAYLVNTQFMPKCELFGYCTEKHSCGRKPKKADVK